MTLMVAEPGRDDVSEHEPVRHASSVDLALGLQLLRASSMTSIRLQLALARRDRRVAMTALDTLAAVDAEIERLVDRLSGSASSSPELAAIATWLAQEKAAVTNDKLNLACDVSGPGLVSPPDRLSEVADAGSDAVADPVAGEAAPDGTSTDAGESASSPHWRPVVLLAIVITALIAGLALGFVLLGGEQLPSIAEVSRLIGLR